MPNATIIHDFTTSPIAFLQHIHTRPYARSDLLLLLAHFTRVPLGAVHFNALQKIASSDKTLIGSVFACCYLHFDSKKVKAFISSIINDNMALFNAYCKGRYDLDPRFVALGQGRVGEMGRAINDFVFGFEYLAALRSDWGVLLDAYPVRLSATGVRNSKKMLKHIGEGDKAEILAYIGRVEAAKISYEQLHTAFTGVDQSQCELSSKSRDNSRENNLEKLTLEKLTLEKLTLENNLTPEKISQIENKSRKNNLDNLTLEKLTLEKLTRGKLTLGKNLTPEKISQIENKSRKNNLDNLTLEKLTLGKNLTPEKISQIENITQLEKDIFYFLKIHLNHNLTRSLSHHFSEHIRIEYLKRIETSTDFVHFIRANQFIDNIGVRQVYIETFRAKLREFAVADDVSLVFKGCTALVHKMCRSNVKVRRELGLNLLLIAMEYGMKPSHKIIQRLSFDSYEEIRLLAVPHLEKRITNGFLLKKLKSYEYADVYSAIQIIKKQGDVDFFIRIFRLSCMKDDLMFGFIALINELNLKMDPEIDSLYSKVFGECKSKYNNTVSDDIDTDDDTRANNLWKTLKEISVYYCNKMTTLANMERITEIMLNINHLGLYTHLYHCLCTKFKRMHLKSFSEIENFIDDLILRCGSLNIAISRRGAGITLLFISILSITEKEHCALIISKLTNIKDGDEIKILAINVLARLTSRVPDISTLVQFCFNALGATRWRVRNAAIQLYSNIIKTLFGRDASDRNNKKHVPDGIRDLFYQNRFKAEYLYLVFLDRLRSTHSENELSFLHACVSKGKLLKHKAIKVLAPKTQNLISGRSMSTVQPVKDLSIVEIFNRLSSEDLECRQNACFAAVKHGFPLVSSEYLMYLIVRDSIECGYYEGLKRTIRISGVIDSKMRCFRDESDNVYFDYAFVKDIIKRKGCRNWI